jgi:predicted outer membrane repeat protein
MCLSPGYGGNAATIANSDYVAFVACELYGGDGVGNGAPNGCLGGPGGNAVSVQGSSVVLYGCTVRGGKGGSRGNSGGDGGDGWVQIDRELIAVGGSITGGGGGIATAISSPTGVGGDGLVVGAAGQADLRATTLAGGAAGESGIAGQPSVNDGQLSFHAGAPRTISTFAVASEASSLGIAVDGPPGDVVSVFESSSPAWQPAQFNTGVWLIPHPLSRREATNGVIGASGTATFSRTMQSIESAPHARIAYLQAFARDNAGTYVSTPWHVVVLDRQAQPDCDGNSAVDWLDLLEGTTGDCDGDFVTDACDLALGAPDCNQNDVRDSCDIADGDSLDVNANTVPDECDPSGLTWYVDDDALPGGDGSASAPFKTIQSAITAAISGDTILVRDGAYAGTGNVALDFGQRSVVVRSENGPSSCTIQGSTTSWTNGWRVGATGFHPRFEGFRFDNLLYAVRVRGGSASFDDCVFEDCYVPYNIVGDSAGAGIWAELGTATITDCSFVRCDAEEGGAIRARYPCQIARCRFEDNTSLRGGAINAFGPSGTSIESCVFTGNSAGRGGAIYVDFSLPVAGTMLIDGSLFADNLASIGGTIAYGGPGTYSVAASELVLANSTIVYNGVGDWEALLLSANVHARISNTILWKHAPQGHLIELQPVHASDVKPLIEIAYSAVQGGTAAIEGDGITVWGAGNLTDDPAFVDPLGLDLDPTTLADNDYRLGPLSPCLDAGDNAAVPPDSFDLDGDLDTREPVPFDLDGSARFVDVPSAPDVGAGSPPLVDIGAFERP